MPMTRREFLVNSLAAGTMSLVSNLDPARRLSGGVSESDVLAFTHVTVIDATGRPALPEQTVLVKGDRIAAIEKFGKLKLPGGAKVIDAKGKYMIPGLWDMHVHAVVAERVDGMFPLFVANGVLGIRDMGTPMPLADIDQLRQQPASGSRLGPRIVAAAHL